MCSNVTYNSLLTNYDTSRIMDLKELDHEIILTRKAVEQLKDDNDYGALELAQADFNYFISQLNE